MRVGLQKTTLVNFPRRVAAAVFLPGCNMRCPYCYNAELACASVTTGPETNEKYSYVPLEEAVRHLEKRAGVLTGVVFSGGEALLSPALPDLIQKARSVGLAIKLDTNGLVPEKLAELLQSKTLCPDMVAIDIKTSPKRYGILMPVDSPQTAAFAEKALLKSLSLLVQPEKAARPLTVEYRTVLVPKLITETEIKTIAALLPKTADWKLAPFLPGECLDPLWNAALPYSRSELEALVRLAQSLIPSAELR
ncbi:anaerobic ribonucleoside-triphosphate reductase activating protein [Treponema phagedenis]|uniref:Anaerobic ribonucleoside-triphosphate reductase activating protein n=1 Tax=Treponema phagedenis TaxID=162 RepID=A0A0B7GZ09_TREPH|nr:anaerobic ribonucleoside-triphosphate reductase activating protein [Treponema phagedenis]NVP22777.1 anaerobic ribonucleoside-triphosphate reductase activating protein [Treponema phagedenis]QEJ95268.1 anaerobic ribonucleoside-triphosphate reductase activating protein [Treponema phagedenis]QEJ98371.1 anaerobic ribonucleoside-triphosphate reductase activating protein [Treponema phagedenis]QEK01121.1 anaerobic ribonucleoside-triphosphate reductase activating protein [Treponema phagedenis]QEK061